MYEREEVRNLLEESGAECTEGKRAGMYRREEVRHVLKGRGTACIAGKR